MIEINALEKGYEKFSLRIPELALEPGKIYALVGKNGAGKTTFLSCLIGERAYGGQITFDGKAFPGDRLEILNELGYVGDFLHFNGDMTVKFFFDFTAHFYQNWDPQLFARLQKRLGIEEYHHRKIKDLSRGNELKVALAACLARKPRYIILDEPTSGLDLVVRGEVMDILEEQKAADRTIIFSTHIVEDIAQCGDHLLVIRDGELVLNQPKETLPIDKLASFHHQIARLVA